MMKVITWNMGYWQHRSCHEDAWRYIREEIKPDIALLQEVKQPQLLEDEDFLFKPIHGEWGTAIYTKCSELEDIVFEGYPNRVATAITKYLGRSLYLVSIHAPIIDNRVFPHLDKIFDEIESLVGDETSIVGGDLNSARLAEEVWPGHGHGPFWERLANSPFFDCMRKFHDKEIQTIFRHDITREWQDDHLFVSKDLADGVISCEVINNKVTRGVSDHIPIVADVDL